MTIQDAIRLCLSQEGQFARPIGWKSTGTAIDIGRRLDKACARKIESLSSLGNLWGSNWNPEPEELLGDWETVSAEELAEEACKLEKLDTF
jgi:hypothetical protein